MDAQLRKEAGNAAFKKGDFAEAIGHYSSSLAAATDANNTDLLAVLLSNRSVGHLKLSESQSGPAKEQSLRNSVADAAACMLAQPSFVRGYLRASAAAQATGDLMSAIGFLESGLDREPRNDALDEQLAKLQLAHPPKSLYPKIGLGHSKAFLYDEEEDEEEDEEDTQEGEGRGRLDRGSNLLDLLSLAVDDALIKGESIAPVNACRALERMRIPGISRLLVPRITSGFVSDVYNICEYRDPQFQMGICCEDLEALPKLILSDGLRGLDVLLNGLKGVYCEPQPLETKFAIRLLCVEMIDVLVSRHSECLRVPEIMDALLIVLEAADPRKRGHDSQYFYSGIIAMLMRNKAVKQQPATLCAIRRAFMKDIVDLGTGWRSFLQENKLPYSPGVDAELAERVNIIKSSRDQWSMRCLGGRYGLDDFDPNNPKCSFVWCDVIQTSEKPFSVLCTCNEAHWCSWDCRMADHNFHAGFCNPAQNPRRPTKGVDKVGQPSGAVQRGSVCDNCLAVAPQGSQFAPCEDCSRAYFCSAFCADYSKRKGAHAKTCLAGARHLCYFKREPHDELEHPGRCILCQRKYGHSEAGEATCDKEIISVCGPCDYKGRYCMCVACHDKIQTSGDPLVQRCPFCRLQLQSRLV